MLKKNEEMHKRILFAVDKGNECVHVLCAHTHTRTQITFYIHTYIHTNMSFIVLQENQVDTTKNCFQNNFFLIVKMYLYQFNIGSEIQNSTEISVFNPNRQ